MVLRTCLRQCTSNSSRPRTIRPRVRGVQTQARYEYNIPEDGPGDPMFDLPAGMATPRQVYCLIPLTLNRFGA